MQNITYPNNWNIASKIAFRFVFIFFILFIITNNNSAYPLWSIAGNKIDAALHIFIPWFARQFLHLPNEITVFTNGSGDTTYNYVLVLVISITACIVCLIWTLADMKRKNYDRLYYWLTVAVRVYVSIMLFNYGLAKIFKTQFPYPGDYRLIQPYGESSPMGLAWTYLGFSKGYNLFMGVAEITALLLLFKRTVAIGAIISLMTTANVMAVNYFFDVPVKILSTMLFVFCLFLLSPNFFNLYELFFKGNPSGIRIISPPPLEKKYSKIFRLSVKGLLILFLLFSIITMNNVKKKYDDETVNTPYKGSFKVLSYVTSHHTMPQKISEDIRWKHFILGKYQTALIQAVGDSVFRYKFEMDLPDKKMSLLSPDSNKLQSTFNYQYKNDTMYLKGFWQNDSIEVRLKKIKPEETTLMGRGFHWINEYPFNR